MRPGERVPLQAPWGGHSVMGAEPGAGLAPSWALAFTIHSDSPVRPPRSQKWGTAEGSWASERGSDPPIPEPGLVSGGRGRHGAVLFPGQFCAALNREAGHHSRERSWLFWKSRPHGPPRQHCPQWASPPATWAPGTVCGVRLTSEVGSPGGAS